MPRIRTTSNPDLVQDVSDKVLLDLQRWGLVLEVMDERRTDADDQAEALERRETTSLHYKGRRNKKTSETTPTVTDDVNVEGPRADDEIV